MKFTRFLADDPTLAEMGERLARMRLDRGLTQGDLASAAGVSKSTVERIENGAGGQLSNLIRVLRALGVLENLERLLPPTAPNPIDLLERRGKVRQRARASRRDHAGVAEAAAPWSWND